MLYFILFADDFKCQRAVGLLKELVYRFERGYEQEVKLQQQTQQKGTGVVREGGGEYSIQVNKGNHLPILNAYMSISINYCVPIYVYI